MLLIISYALEVVLLYQQPTRSILARPNTKGSPSLAYQGKNLYLHDC